MNTPKIVPLFQTLGRVNSSLFYNGIVRMPMRLIRVGTHDGLKSYPENLLGETLVDVLEDSGPLFGKIGQILSTRTDLLGKNICEKLKKLQSEGTPLSKREVKSIIKKQYSKNPFKSFDWEPLGVGTIGQAHRAQLKNNHRVVVKILRPQSKKYLDKDIDTFETLLNLLSLIMSPDKVQALKIPLSDLIHSMKNETDLLTEAQNLEKLKKLTNNKKIYFPRVYKSLSSSQVLVMEEIEGKPLSSYSPNSKVAREIGTRALKELLVQAFDKGLFHADPHPGNLFVMKDGRLAFIDLGLVGEFRGQDRKNLVKALKAFLSKDTEKTFKSLLQLGVKPPNFDEAEFKKDISKVFKAHKSKISQRAQNKDQDPKTLHNFINELFLCSYRHGLYIPPSTSLLIKSLVTIEGVARQYNPELNLSEVVVSVVLDILKPKWMNWFR